jgi:hypothetical protein
LEILARKVKAACGRADVICSADAGEDPGGQIATAVENSGIRHVVCRRLELQRVSVDEGSVHRQRCPARERAEPQVLVARAPPQRPGLDDADTGARIRVDRQCLGEGAVRKRNRQRRVVLE